MYLVYRVRQQENISVKTTKHKVLKSINKPIIKSAIKIQLKLQNTNHSQVNKISILF